MRAVFGGMDQIRAPEIQWGHSRRQEDLPAAASDRFADEFLIAIHFGRVEEQSPRSTTARRGSSPPEYLDVPKPMAGT